MNPESLQRYLQLYSYLIIPLSLLEGFATSRFSLKIQWHRTGFFLHTACALVIQLLLYFFLTVIPDMVSQNGWRIVPADHWDNLLYSALLLVVLGGIKLLIFRFLQGKQTKEGFSKKHGMTAGILCFLCFNAVILCGAVGAGQEELPNSTGNISYTFPYGIDYFTSGKDGEYADVSQRHVLGRVIPLNQVVPPYPCEKNKITFFQIGSEFAKLQKTTVPFDSEGKTNEDASVLVSTGKYGGLVIVRNGKLILLNRQSLLHRWDTPAFTFIPGYPCILFRVNQENFIFDYHRQILYPLFFSNGRIFAFGIRKTAEPLIRDDQRDEKL